MLRPLERVEIYACRAEGPPTAEGIALRNTPTPFAGISPVRRLAKSSWMERKTCEWRTALGAFPEAHKCHVREGDLPEGIVAAHLGLFYCPAEVDNRPSCLARNRFSVRRLLCCGLRASHDREPDRRHEAILILNSNHSLETKYATLVHELTHLYCGHLGTPNQKWWPDRTGLHKGIQEFEAESLCHLVCERLGIVNPSAKYLANYLKENEEGDVPAISFERVMASAGLIEQMGCERLKPRKEKEK
jgi:IrrE N-terminal-like domain